MGPLPQQPHTHTELSACARLPRPVLSPSPPTSIKHRLNSLFQKKKRSPDQAWEEADLQDSGGDGPQQQQRPPHAAKRRSMQERKERTSIEQWHEARKSRYGAGRRLVHVGPMGAAGKGGQAACSPARRTLAHHCCRSGASSSKRRHPKTGASHKSVTPRHLHVHVLMQDIHRRCLLRRRQRDHDREAVAVQGVRGCARPYHSVTAF